MYFDKKNGHAQFFFPTARIEVNRLAQEVIIPSCVTNVALNFSLQMKSQGLTLQMKVNTILILVLFVSQYLEKLKFGIF